MKTKKLVHGMGLNDADYAVVERETISDVNGKQKRKQVWICPYYRSWADMLKRCYSAKHKKNRPTYSGCSVSEEWLTFSSFRAWMAAQDWEGKQLDKDLLFKGNKVYSAESCVFVTQTVNSFTTDSGATRGEWLIGVCWNKQLEKFHSSCRNPFTKKRDYLGHFATELEAHEAWLKRKLELAKELAAIQTDPQVAKALVDRYSKPYIDKDLLK